MKKVIVTFAVLFWCLAGISHAQTKQEPIRLFVPDGQLASLPIQVFVTHDVTLDMNPYLRLSGRRTTADPEAVKQDSIPLLELARHQQWSTVIEGKKMSFAGTLMLFDLSDYPIPIYKPMTRIIPALQWQEQAGQTREPQTAVTAQQVYLGNRLAAVLWTLIVVASVVFMLIRWSLSKHDNAFHLIVESSGKMSLYRCQIAAWTLAIGSLVAMFGFIQLQVPDLPESLLVLMGLSLTTGGFSYFSKSSHPSEKNPPAARLRDLIVDSDPKNAHALSRAQMIFWTVIMLALFVAKSLIDGVLWAVPWEMVALMGMSQAAYVVPKYKNGTPQTV